MGILGAVHRPTANRSCKIHGTVAPGFEGVRTEFERNFRDRGEIGAAVAAYWKGNRVVDLWGGRRDPSTDDAWEEDTAVCVMSCTKGMSASALALAHSRGWLDYDQAVSTYWPEFARHGKSSITVRQLLNHEAGLVVLDQPLTLKLLGDLDALASVLARQRPAWPPGTRHGYHTVSLGLYMQELLRRIDPQRRSLGQFFEEELAVPLGADFHIGLPPDFPSSRLAGLATLSPGRALWGLRVTPRGMVMKMLEPRSLLRRSFLLPELDWNDRRTYGVEIPAGNGVGTARAIARVYSVFADGGAELDIRPQTLNALTAPPTGPSEMDEVLGVPTCFQLGFLRPGWEAEFGSTVRAFGAPGAGGSFGYADPDARLGYSYVMNKLDFYLSDDPREKSLREAVYRGIATRA